MLALALFACAHRAPPRPPDLADVALAPVSDLPVHAVSDAVVPLPRGTLYRAGGRLWALVGAIGAREILALDADGAVRWRAPVQDDGYWRVSEDGRFVVRADFLGCIEVLDADTGARVRGFTWTIDPWSFDVSPDGAHVWTLHEDGLVGWDIAANTRIATYPLADDEAPDLFLAPDGTFAWLQTEAGLTTRRLSDGAVLGRAPLRDHALCEIDGDRIWVEPRWDAGDPFPLDARTLDRVGPADPTRCAPYGRAGTRAITDTHYCVTLRDTGWATPLGTDLTDALLDADGAGWWEVHEGVATHYTLHPAATALLPKDAELTTTNAALTWESHRLSVLDDAGAVVAAFTAPRPELAALADGHVVTTTGGLVRVHALPDGELVAK
ncbi:MAG: hypothetical protein ACK4YP_26655, partial [Myxococcota bacterium]